MKRALILIILFSSKIFSFCKEITKITVLEITLEDCQKLAPHQEELIFKLAKKLGVNKKIEVFKMNPIKRDKMSRGAYTFLGKVFIDDNVFNMPEDEICTIVGKELMRVENHHDKIQALGVTASLIASFGAYNYLYKKINDYFQSDFVEPISKILLISILSGSNYLSYSIIGKILDKHAGYQLKKRHDK